MTLQTYDLSTPVLTSYSTTPAVPAVPVVLGVMDNVGPVQGLLHFGSWTDDARPTLFGTGHPGDVITLLDATSGSVGSTVVAADGTWSVQPQVALGDGMHALDVTATNTAGVTGDESNSAAVLFIDTTTPAVPVVLGVMDNVGPVQGLLHFGSWTDDARPMLFGTGHPGDVITLLDAGASVGSTVVAADGTWSVQPQVALRDGMHALDVTATNKAGSTGDESSGAAVLFIDTTTPSAPSITSVMDNTGSVTGPIPAGGTTDETRPVISGTGQSGHIVMLYDGATLIGSSTVSGGGQWTVQSAEAMSATVHNLSAVEFTKAGVQSAPSEHFLFLIETPVLKSVMHVSETSDQSDAASVTGHETIVHSADPAQSSIHATVPGEVTSEGVSVLHVTSDHGVIDLASLVAKPVAAKASSADAIDVTAQHAVLKLSLIDVLNAGEQDLFQKDGKQQLMINGKEGDTVDLSNSHVAGLAEGEWQNHGTAQVSGVTYNVYEHSGAHAELLVQQGTQIVLH